MIAISDPTSLKQIIQRIASDDVRVVQGTVISTSPLKIQIANDEKLVIRSAVVPRHLTDHTVKVTIPDSGSHAQYSGSGTHSHSGVMMTVYNALQVGDVVHLLSYAKAKQYFVLDRV